MNKQELVQHMQRVIVDDPKLGAYVTEEMKRMYPELKPELFEQDEEMEESWYARINTIITEIMNEVISGLSTSKN